MTAPTESDFSSLQQEVESLRSVEPDNTYLLYAMGLRLSTMDYYSLRLNNLLDGPDDKKIDFFNIDNDSAICTIAQGYFSEDWSRREPPATKASDLNTAMAWLLESDITGIPRPEVRACAEQLRDGLNSGDVLRLEIFYVHNLPSSANVDAELRTVRRTTSRLLQRYERGSIAPECDVNQASREILEQWRRTQHEAISVHDTITLRSSMAPQVLETAEWRAAIGTVSADDLVALRLRYGDALTSANVRDYLGSRESSRNLNRQIQKTVIDEPSNFWIYNNGITVLTNGIHINGNEMTLSGFSIINCAQTTGSLSEAATHRPLRDAQVLVRAIKCNDRGLIDTVIRYNNTQNPIKAWELRVIDPIQRRLQAQFADIGISYQLRRSVARRRANDVLFEKLAPSLSAFYGDPFSAHRNRPELFESERRYRELFPMILRYAIYFLCTGLVTPWHTRSRDCATGWSPKPQLPKRTGSMISLDMVPSLTS